MKNKLFSIFFFTLVIILTISGCSGKHEFKVANNDQWREAINAIISAGNDVAHVINIKSNISITGNANSTFGEITGITVTIIGNKKISLAEGSIGPLLHITNDQTVILQDVDLEGHSNNRYPLIYAIGKSLIMRGTASVFGNTGGGVAVGRGTFIMQESASVYNNIGCGIAINSTFTMQDNASVHDNINRDEDGGGVYAIGKFTMQDKSSVYGNAAKNGGGVYARGEFIILGTASVYNNTASNEGGGIYINGGRNGGTLVMIGSTVYGNKAKNGGGVYGDAAQLSIEGNASVYGNIVTGNGGGVCLGYFDSETTYFPCKLVIKEGTVFGNNAEEGYKNIANKGAALYEYNTYTSRWGSITAIEETIK